jgi:formate dehydrogenase iron-sulfur subunit
MGSAVARRAGGPCGQSNAVDRLVRISTALCSIVLEDICNTMKFGSLCALGGFAPYPVMSAVRYFREDFAPRVLAAAE